MRIPDIQSFHLSLGNLETREQTEGGKCPSEKKHSENQVSTWKAEAVRYKFKVS